MRIIPEELNRKLKREYRLRFLTMLFVSVSISIVVTTALVSSSYLLLHLYKKAYVKEGTQIINEVDGIKQEVEQKTKGLYQLLKKISGKDQDFVFITQKIFDNAGSLVTIQSLEILSDNQIVLRVFSPNRSALLSFEKKMKEDTDFKNFIVPVESLARQENINVSINFTYDKN